MGIEDDQNLEVKKGELFDMASKVIEAKGIATRSIFNRDRSGNIKPSILYRETKINYTVHAYLRDTYEFDPHINAYRLTGEMSVCKYSEVEINGRKWYGSKEFLRIGRDRLGNTVVRFSDEQSLRDATLPEIEQGLEYLKAIFDN